MIKTKGVDIICSYGDTFECAWDVEGIEVTGDVTFSVKATAESTDILLSTAAQRAEQRISVFIDAETFGRLAVGDYVYDLVMVSGGKKVTLLFPAQFSVRAVVHDVD